MIDKEYKGVINSAIHFRQYVSVIMNKDDKDFYRSNRNIWLQVTGLLETRDFKLIHDD